MTILNYPRLLASDASQLLVELGDVVVGERVERGASYRGRATVYATAVNLATDDHLAGLRQAVLEVAEKFGFPNSTPNQEFDDALPGVLCSRMAISPVEAGSVEVWNYISLVLLPDVALWRWPNEKRNPGYERLIGKPRNVFRRHWWRGHLLGEDLPTALREDELVAIVERSSSLGSDPRVARTVARAFLELVDTHRIRVDGELKPFQRMMLMRDLAKRVLRIGRVVALSTLDDLNLRELVAELATRSGETQADERGGQVERIRESSRSLALEPTQIAELRPDEIEGLLNQELDRLVERTGAELRVSTSAMRRMLADFGGVQAARQVVADQDSEWFTAVAAAGRVDYSFEAVIVREPFSSLFEGEELAIARETLTNYERLVASGATHDEFAQALEIVSARARQATGFHSPAMKWMLDELGPVATVARLVGFSRASENFQRLARRGRLDLSLERLTLDPRYANLFAVEVRRKAHERLTDELANQPVQ